MAGICIYQAVVSSTTIFSWFYSWLLSVQIISTVLQQTKTPNIVLGKYHLIYISLKKCCQRFLYETVLAHIFDLLQNTTEREYITNVRPLPVWVADNQQQMDRLTAKAINKISMFGAKALRLKLLV